MKKILLLLANHLGEKYSKNTFDEVYIIEDDLFFDSHKLKVAFLKAIVMASKIKVLKQSEIIKENQYFMYDPLNYKIQEKYKNLIDNLIFLELENSFILQKNHLDDLYETFKNNKLISHGTFFKKVKHIFSILVDVPSTDHENREKLKDTSIVPSIKTDKSNIEIKLNAILWTNTNYPNNYGNAEELKNLPITKKDAKQYLRSFIKTRLYNFGKYEDATVENNDSQGVILFHSHCSFLLNCGLLTPRFVIDEVLKEINNIPINSIEGFIRQLLGWREYMRFIHRFWGKDLIEKIKNGNGNKLDFKIWTSGNTGIYPIDNEIKKVIKYGWCHHIIRLMFFLNIMKLQKNRSQDIYDWFMKFISLDAYEWVMVSNIASMGFFSINPKFMHKEYVSSSNYILKMSNYKKGDWCKTWDNLYRNYITKK